MDWYVSTMYSLSILGLSVIVSSVYCVLFVPAKLSLMNKAAILLHALMSGTNQLLLTVGTIPVLFFPCVAGYPRGVLTRLGMKTFVQFVFQVGMIAITGWCVSVLTLLRVLAVSVQISDRTKELILRVCYVFLILQTILIAAFSPQMKTDAEKGRRSCEKKFNYTPPPEIYLENALFLNFDPAEDLTSFLLACDTLFICIVIGGIIIASGVLLIKSLRSRIGHKNSSRMAVQQRKLTLGTLYFTTLEISGICVPSFFFILSILMDLNLAGIEPFLFFCMGTFPMIGCFLVLRLNPVYNEKINSCLLKLKIVF